MAPPDFPQPEHYRPLGTLLQAIKRGQRFHPLTVLDIRRWPGQSLAMTSTPPPSAIGLHDELALPCGLNEASTCHSASGSRVRVDIRCRLAVHGG